MVLACLFFLIQRQPAQMKMTGFGFLEDRMMTPQMIDDSVEITRFAIDQDIHVNITINNRTGGNAPIIAQEIAKRFVEEYSANL
jgi:hypothetical protein